MRRLVLEIDAEEISRFVKESSKWVEKVDSLEVLNFLKETPRESALVCRVSFKDSATRVKDIFTAKGVECQTLDKERNGTYICFIRKKRAHGVAPVGLLVSGAYLSTPYELHDGKVRTTFLGTAIQIRRLLRIVEKSFIRYRIVSLSDAKFSPNSPINNLTEKQRRVLITAYNLGYYDLPKRISSEELARKLNMRSSTLVMHRIRAEKRLIAENLKQR